MFLPSWLTRPRTPRPTRHPLPKSRLGVEALEGRDVPAALLAISDVSVWEYHKGMVSAVFTVTLSEPSTQAVTVNYSTADGTARGGHDYAAASGALTFAPGETSKTIVVAVKGDTRIEANETFLVNLSGAVNAQIGDGQGVGTILDDDARDGDHCHNYGCAGV